MSAVTTIGKNRIINIRSSDRIFGVPSNFGVNFGHHNLNPTYCSWHQVALPNGFYNVSARSNTFSVTIYDASSVAHPLTFTVTPGNYNSTSLNTAFLFNANAAAATISGAGSSFFSGSINNLSGYYTLSSTVSLWSFTINTALASLDWILGFRSIQQSSLTLATTATGAVILDLRSPPCVYIRCSLVSGNSISHAGSDSVICVVQNTALYSQTIFQRAPMPDIDLFSTTGQMGHLQFQLVDEYGYELNMDSNQDWEISIALFFQ